MSTAACREPRDGRQAPAGAGDTDPAEFRQLSLDDGPRAGPGDEPAPTPERSGWLFWPLHAAYWLIVWAGSRLMIDIFRPDIPTPESFIASRVAVGFVATAAVRALSRRPALLARYGLSKPGAVMGGVIIVAVAVTILQDRLWLAFGDIAVESPSRWTVAMFIVRFAMLAGWAGLYLAATLLADANAQHERALRAESAALRGELRALQAQVNPHFLFNALNCVLGCKDDPDAVERVTQGLADYLRFTLRQTKPLEPLGRELDALEGYVAVQETRFGDRLVCTIDCDPAARWAPAPPMLLQPLLENALKYGADTSPPPLRVTVSARVVGDRLETEVANSGRWVEPDPSRSSGIGLRSLRTRLELLYGDAAEATVSDEGGMVRVRVRIPISTGAMA